MINALEKFKQDQGVFEVKIENIEETPIGTKVSCSIQLIKQSLLETFHELMRTAKDDYTKQQFEKYVNLFWNISEKVYTTIDSKTEYQEVLTEILEISKSFGDEYDYGTIEYMINKYITKQMYLVEDIINELYLNTIYLIFDLSRTDRVSEMIQNDITFMELRYGYTKFLLKYQNE